MTHENWNFDNSGNAVVPADAPVEHNQLVAAMENYQSTPRSEVGTAVTTTEVPAKSKSISGLPDWDRPRNKQGQFLAKSDAELRATWDKEGGFATNAAKVMAVESAILSASQNPAALQSHIATLPNDIKLKAADVMRLTTAYGPDGGANKWGQFVNSLTPSQQDAFETWWRGLSRGDQDAILGSISL